MSAHPVHKSDAGARHRRPDVHRLYTGRPPRDDQPEGNGAPEIHG